MSLANSEKMIFGSDETRLLIDESPYQFLPSLAQIFSDTGALVLQQLHYVARHPYFEGERLPTQWKDGLFFVQIPGFMWWDEVEGFLRHLAKRTFERKVSELKEAGVLVVENRVGHFRDQENYRWYAINYAKLKELEDEHRANYLALKEQRERERAAVKVASDGTANWRPKNMGAETSRQNGASLAPLTKKPSETRPDSPKKPLVARGSRHFGERSKQAIAPAILASEPPAILAALSLYKRHKETFKNTDDTASLEMSSANADAVVESNLILSGDCNDKTKPDVGLAREAQQIALRETALTALPSPLSEPLATLAARFHEVATEEYGLKCDQELAARIVRQSPLATISDAAVVRLIGPDHGEAGLDKALFGEKKRALSEKVPELRWLLFVWPAHRAEVQAWAARKKCAVNMAGAFVTKWEEGTPPPRDWMAAKIGAMRAEIRAEEAAQEGGRAKEVWDGLSGPQRAAVASHGAMRAAERGGGNWNDQKEREARERRGLLLDVDFMAALPSLVEAQTKAATGAVPKFATESESENAAPTKYVPSTSELSRMQFHAQKLLPQVRRGELDLDAAEDHAIGAWLYSPKQAAVIREMVEVLVNAESKEAVA